MILICPMGIKYAYMHGVKRTLPQAKYITLASSARLKYNNVFYIG